MELIKEIPAVMDQLPTGNIADNNSFSPHQGVMDSGIKPLDPACHMVGRAVTVQCFPGDNLALHQGIYAAAPGDILVLDCHGYTESGYFGDIMALACKVRGITGVIIDGSCRDAEDIKKLGLPVFVRGINPAGTVKASVGQVNIPVLCGGVKVHPGDLIVGDCDGVVVIEKEHEDEVYLNSKKKFEKEEKIVQQLMEGKTTIEIYGFEELLT